MSTETNAAAEDMAQKEVSAPELAAVLGITRQRVNQLVADNIIKRTSRAKHPLAVSVQSFIAYKLRTQADGMEKSTAAEDYELHRARLYKARADAAEIDAALRLGEVIHGEIAEELWTSMIMKMRARMLAIPGKLAPVVVESCTPRDAFKLMQDEIHEALQNIADYDPQPIIEEWHKREGMKAAKSEKKSKGDNTGDAGE